MKEEINYEALIFAGKAAVKHPSCKKDCSACKNCPLKLDYKSQQQKIPLKLLSSFSHYHCKNTKDTPLTISIKD